MKNKVYATLKNGKQVKLPNTFDDLHKLTLPNPGSKSDGGCHFTNPNMRRLAAKHIGISMRSVAVVSTVPA